MTLEQSFRFAVSVEENETRQPLFGGAGVRFDGSAGWERRGGRSGGWRHELGEVLHARQCGQQNSSIAVPGEDDLSSWTRHFLERCLGLQVMSEVQLFYGCDGVPRKAIRLLLRFGFSRHGRTFNRRTEDGLTQVVFFNEVPEQSPDSDFIALTTAAAQKLLDVRLGVYVPEVCDLVDGRKIGDHVPFDRCTFCTTARRLIHGTYVNWDDSPLELLLLLNSVLFDHGFRFFSEYESRDRILAHLEKPGQHVGGAVVTRIACAIILAHRGEKKRAEALLWAQARENRDKDRNEYLRDLSRRLRLGEL